MQTLSNDANTTVPTTIDGSSKTEALGAEAEVLGAALKAKDVAQESNESNEKGPKAQEEDDDDEEEEDYGLGNFPHNKILHGVYKHSMDKKNSKFVYIPSQLLINSNFEFDNVFKAFKQQIPNLLCVVNNCEDTDQWNVRLPKYRSNLIGIQPPNGALEHYQGG